MDKRKKSLKNKRIKKAADAWNLNKTETKRHENYTAVMEKQVLAKQYAVVPKKAEKLELICKKKDEGRIKIDFKRGTEVVRHNMVAQNREVQTQLRRLYNLS